MKKKRGGKEEKVARKKPIIIAHKCNTKKAIEEALKYTSWIEVDVMITTDEQLVIGHPGGGWQAIDWTLEQILDLYKEKVEMTFGEFAEFVLSKGKKIEKIFLDLKYERMGQGIIGKVMDCGLLDKVIIISRSQEDLESMSMQALKLGWIVDGSILDPYGVYNELGCQYFIMPWYAITEKVLEEFRLNQVEITLIGEVRQNQERAVAMVERGIKFIMANDHLKEICEALKIKKKK